MVDCMKLWIGICCRKMFWLIMWFWMYEQVVVAKCVDLPCGGGDKNEKIVLKIGMRKCTDEIQSQENRNELEIK